MTPAASDSSENNPGILVVEDNLVNQKVILGMLKKYGYTADIAINGEEALRILADNSYSLIFMDCQMPVMDGYITTQSIREHESNETHTTIIAMTANAMPSDEEKCLSVGMDDYIAKPVDPAVLKEKLDKWIPE